VGEKYSNEWQVQHLKAPRSVVPESIMPNYPWLLENDLDFSDIADRLRALKKVGVPYSESKTEYDANVQQFGQDVADMLDIQKAQENLIKQAQSGNYDGIADRITEMEALVAYLQMLGTLVDFSQYDEGHFVQFR
jgi:cytochrome c oxidase cbb3-type subunit 2